MADEPTSALDVSVRDAVLDLFEELQTDWSFACLFISHDLAVVDRLADEVAVLRDGVLREIGTRDAVLRNPQTEYTRRLVAAVPVPDPAEQRRRRKPPRACSSSALSRPRPGRGQQPGGPDLVQRHLDGAAVRVSARRPVVR